MRRESWRDFVVRGVSAMSLSLLLASSIAACGDDDNDGSPAPAATVTPVPTVTPTVTPHEHSGQGHVEVLIGSMQDGSGELVAHPEFDHVEVPYSACLGGDDAHACEGGTRVYTVANPGIESIEEDEGDLFALVDGTGLRLEVLAIDAGLSLVLEGVALDEAGESVVLGSTPLHTDAEATIAVAANEEPKHHYELTFRITSDAPGYEASASTTIEFQAVDEEEHAEEEQHGDE